jgi:hypothetical protein
MHGKISKCAARLAVRLTLVAACLGGGASLAFAEEADSTPGPPDLEAVPEGPRIDVADSSTRVLIAKVHLNVGSLRLEEGALVGNYALDVPLVPKKSEGGTLSLRFDTSIDLLLREGGKLRGTGHSFKEDKPPRTIIATIHPPENEAPKGRLDLEIDVGERVIEFETSYHVRQPGP